MALPGAGLLSYNRVDLGANPLLQTTVTARVIQDDARLVTKAVAFTFHTRGYFTAADDVNTDPDMEDFYHKLTETGKGFIAAGYGVGDVKANLGVDGVWDPTGGPHPEMVTWKPTGGQLTAEMEWKCTVTVPKCPDAVYARALSQLCYEVTWDVDNGGWTVRRTLISVEVPQHVENGRPKESADRTLFDVLPPRIEGFKRTVSRQLSKNKARMEITVTDAEIPVNLPGGVDVCTLEWGVKSRMIGSAFRRWSFTLSGEVRMASNHSPVDVQDRFLVVLASRLGNIHATAGRTESGRSAMVTEFAVRENIYGRSTHFSLSGEIFRSSLTNIFRDSGMWQPISRPGGGFQNDRYVGTLPGARGRAGLSHDPDQDAVISLCRRVTRATVPQNPPNDGPPNPPVVGGGRTGAGVSTTPRPAPPPRPQRPPLLPDGWIQQLWPNARPGQAFPGRGERPPRVAPEDSWVAYDVHVRYLRENNVARHKPIGVRVPTEPLAFPVDGSADRVSRLQVPAGPDPGPPAIAPGSSGRVPDVLQTVGGPSCRIALYGVILRFEHEADVPELLTVGGQTAVEKMLWFDRSTPGAVGGVPLHRLEFAVVYELPGAPGSVPLPANPVLGIDGHR